MYTVKKTGKTDGKSNKLGGGGRFQQLENQGASAGLAAYIGRKMYGKKKMAKMAAKGKEKESKKEDRSKGEEKDY